MPKSQRTTVHASPCSTDPRERKRPLLFSSQSSPQEWALLSSMSCSSTASCFSLLAGAALQQAEMEMQEVATISGGMASTQTERAKERIHGPELLKDKSAWGGRWTGRITSKPKGSRELH